MGVLILRLLIISDSHLENNILDRIHEKFKNIIDIYIHCGDSSLDIDDPLLQGYVVVKGNHDDAFFPLSQEMNVDSNRIFITHGHLYHVYRGYDELLSLAKQKNYRVVLHGHTHVPTHQVIDHIHFINPGSIMMNRGSYGFGTFAIMDIHHQQIKVHFYHHETFELCDHLVLDEGLQWLEDFKKFAF